MKPCIAAVPSITAMKHLVLGTVVFAIASQIIQALLTKQVIVSSHHWTHSNLQQTRLSTSLDEYTDRATPATTKVVITEVQSQSIEWKSNEMKCTIMKYPTRNSSSKSKNFTGLPEKFARIQLPPEARPECGSGSLQRPWSLDKAGNPWMIFIVKSAPHHFAYRNMVRISWGSISSFYNKTFIVIFLLGQPNSPNRTEEWQRAIEEENRSFGDILQCSVQDTYQNLPTKVLDSFRWMVQQNFSESYYTITDDDCMMRIPNIHLFFDHLKPKEASESIFCGFLYDAASKPIRERRNKWSVSTEIYPGRIYPTFCHGGMYTMKKQIMKSIYCASEVTNTTSFTLEDVLITGILREKLGQEDANIKPVTTATGKIFDVMYYPWENSPGRTLWKMGHKWSAWNRTFTQYRRRKILKIRPPPPVSERSRILTLQSFWKREWMGIARKTYMAVNSTK